jgi:hypothetical protein
MIYYYFHLGVTKMEAESPGGHSTYRTPLDILVPFEEVEHAKKKKSDLTS